MVAPSGVRGIGSESAFQGGHLLFMSVFPALDRVVHPASPTMRSMSGETTYLDDCPP